MDKENLFPEKDLIDMSFINLIRFDNNPPTSKEEVDKAIHEYGCLAAKLNELNKLYDKTVKMLFLNKNCLSDSISNAMTKITDNVDDYLCKHWTDFSISYGDGDKCELSFEHGSIILEQKVINKLKIKPGKEK